MDKIKELFVKYKSFIMYAIFGVLTTVVNIASYWFFAHPCGLLDKAGTALPNALAWIVSCTFAYITNRIWVFESKNHALKSVLIEIVSFFACRFATLLLDLGIMWLFVDKIGFNDLIIKIISNVIVIVVNYVFSKLVIFKKHDK